MVKNLRPHFHFPVGDCKFKVVRKKKIDVNKIELRFDGNKIIFDLPPSFKENTNGPGSSWPRTSSTAVKKGKSHESGFNLLYRQGHGRLGNSRLMIFTKNTRVKMGPEGLGLG